MEETIRLQEEDGEKVISVDRENIIISGGGVTKPETWAELKSMSATDLQKVFPEGSVIDTITCKWTSTRFSSMIRDIKWIIANYGTCQLENDDTNYPCVTLLSKFNFGVSMAFDWREQVQCNSSTDTVAEDGVYYYGTTSSSGNIAASNTTALNLATGSAIPYGSYARIFKSSVNTNNTNFVNMWVNGYNNYKLSNIRQWLNSTANNTNWFVPTHVGDTKATSYDNNKGFQSGFTSDFLNVVSPTKINVIANSTTDSSRNEVMYDKFFLPSRKEVGFNVAPAEGEIFTGIIVPSDRAKTAVGTTMPANTTTEAWWLRSPESSSYSEYIVTNVAGQGNANAVNATPTVVVACRIILEG